MQVQMSVRSFHVRVLCETTHLHLHVSTYVHPVCARARARARARVCVCVKRFTSEASDGVAEMRPDSGAASS